MSSALLDAGVARGDVSCRSVQAWRRASAHGTARTPVSTTGRIAPALRVGDSIRAAAPSGRRFATAACVSHRLRLAPYCRRCRTERGGKRGAMLWRSTSTSGSRAHRVPPGPFDIRDIPTTTGNVSSHGGDRRAVGKASSARRSIRSLLLRPGLLELVGRDRSRRTGFLGPSTATATASRTVGAPRHDRCADARSARRDARGRGHARRHRNGSPRRRGRRRGRIAQSRDDDVSGSAFLLGYLPRS